ncbi:MAG: hypothetical protein ACM3UZ_01635 [Acidobacteriota bacterium]
MAMSTVGAAHSGKTWPIKHPQHNGETDQVEKNKEQSFHQTMHEVMHEIKKDVKEARQLQAAAPKQEASSPLKHGGHGYIRVENIQKALDTQAASFQDEINKVLGGLDIDTDNPINLTYQDGKLSVGDDNPDQSAIEEALAGEPSLINSFFETVFLNGMSKGGQEANNQGYDKNPRAALAQFGHLFSKDSLEKNMIQLLYQDSKWTVQVKPIPAEGDTITPPAVEPTDTIESSADSSGIAETLV